MAQPCLEVCLASADDAVVAATAGADRLELNAALELGGLTPSLGLAEEVLHAVAIPVIAMLRPRAGGFCYSPRERQTMLRDAARLLDLGVHGLACGALQADGDVDWAFWHQLAELTGGRELVFHRAFDAIGAPPALLRPLADAGTRRILTSGGRPTAFDGAAHLAELVREAAGAIEILPGSGIRPGNLAELLQQTGLRQVHGSFQRTARDAAPHMPQSSFPQTDPDAVAAARRVLDEACGHGS